MKLRPADEIAAEFMLGNGSPHFCDRDDCGCTKRLAEIIQWSRHEGAEQQRRQDARLRLHAPVAPGNRIAEALAETRAETSTRAASGGGRGR